MLFAFVTLSFYFLQASAFAQEDREAEKPAFELPKPDGWNVGDPRAFAAEQAGFSVAYNMPDPLMTVTLYQFNRGLDSIPDDVESEAIKEEMAGVHDAIQQAKRLGYYDKAEEKAAKTITLGESKVKALWCRYLIEKRGEQTNSQCFVTTSNNRFIKIRVTFEDSEKAQEKLNELIAEFGKAIESASNR